MFQREIRHFSVVRRWATLRLIQSQNLAEHSFYVGFYADQIAAFIGLCSLDRLAVADYARVHDASEVVSGDQPGPWKRLVQDKERVSVVEKRVVAERFGEDASSDPSPIARAVVKVADSIDELMFLANDFQLGNKAVGPVMHNSFENFQKAVRGIPDKFITDNQRADLGLAVSEAWRRHMFDVSNHLMG